MSVLHDNAPEPVFWKLVANGTDLVHDITDGVAGVTLRQKVDLYFATAPLANIYNLQLQCLKGPTPGQRVYTNALSTTATHDFAKTEIFVSTVLNSEDKSNLSLPTSNTYTTISSEKILYTSSDEIYALQGTPWSKLLTQTITLPEGVVHVMIQAKIYVVHDSAPNNVFWKMTGDGADLDYNVTEGVTGVLVRQPIVLKWSGAPNSKNHTITLEALHDDATGQHVYTNIFTPGVPHSLIQSEIVVTSFVNTPIPYSSGTIPAPRFISVYHETATYSNIDQIYTLTGNPWTNLFETVFTLPEGVIHVIVRVKMFILHSDAPNIVFWKVTGDGADLSHDVTQGASGVDLRQRVEMYWAGSPASNQHTVALHVLHDNSNQTVYTNTFTPGVADLFAHSEISVTGFITS